MLFLNTNLVPAAALAYTALQACSKSRYARWFEHYTKFLYVIAACTQVIARQSKGEDKDSAQALHTAVKDAQSKIVEHIRAQQKSDRPEWRILWNIKESKLESVGGISDEMLDAMVEYANSDNPYIYDTEYPREWVKNLKQKRDEAKQVQ